MILKTAAFAAAAAAFSGAVVDAAESADADAIAGGNALKPKWVVDGVFMDEECGTCFPHEAKTCNKELWRRCCAQEISCHDYHCRSAIWGELKPGDRVRAREDFLSDDEARAELNKGMSGKVVKTDGDGGAFIKFQRDDLDDDDFVSHWVFKTTFWDKLELPGKAGRLRAAKLATCMDSCIRGADCRLNDMTKKRQKTFQTCTMSCKFEKCREDVECSEMLQAYQTCKQEASSKGKCKASTPATAPSSEL